MPEADLDMVVLTSGPLWQVQMIASFLEDSGIPTLLSEGYPSGAPSILRVPAGRLAEAQRALEDADNSDSGSAE